MFENIGAKIKSLAKVIFWVVTCGMLIGAFVLADYTEGSSLIFAVIGVLVAWISSWFLYGFGEIIDKLCDIERNTRK